MSSTPMNIRQSVGLQVIRKSGNNIKDDKFEKPIICKNCGNKRFWVVRCEHCGSVDKD